MLLFSRSVVSNSLRPHGLQHANNTRYQTYFNSVHWQRNTHKDSETKQIHVQMGILYMISNLKYKGNYFDYWLRIHLEIKLDL